MVFRFTADRPGAYSGRVFLADMHQGTIVAEGNRLVSTGNLRGYGYHEGSALKESPPKP